jgi:hypothetical protein
VNGIRAKLENAEYATTKWLIGNSENKMLEMQTAT